MNRLKLQKRKIKDEKRGKKGEKRIFLLRKAVPGWFHSNELKYCRQSPRDRN